jgi:hypothetical protein
LPWRVRVLATRKNATQGLPIVEFRYADDTVRTSGSSPSAAKKRKEERQGFVFDALGKIGE